MSDYRIAVTCTRAQWEEICEGFHKNKIAWPLTYDGVYCNDYTISCSCKWSSNPFQDGSVEALSAYYPTAVFYCSVVHEESEEREHFWLLAGKSSYRRPNDQEVQETVREGSLRYLSATSSSARGVEHSIELMPNGKVAFEGQNIFGECDVLAWKDMRAIACGDWHTVGQTLEGNLLACGSNANGQCDVQLFGQKLKQLSCGRYHTAILYENGKVSVRGALEAFIAPGSGGIPSRRNAYTYMKENEVVFPVSIDIEGTGYAGRAARVDKMQVGDSLTLRANWNSPYYDPVAIEVFNQDGESLGYLQKYTASLEAIAGRLASLTASAESVTPLAARSKRAKYPLMTVRIEEGRSPQSDLWELPWESIVAIRSIHDAVIAVDANGQVYSQGSHGLDEQAYHELLQELGAQAGAGPLKPVKTEPGGKKTARLEAEAGDEEGSFTYDLQAMFDANLRGYNLAFMLGAAHRARMVKLSEKDQERFGALLSSRVFHQSIGTDLYLHEHLLDVQYEEAMEPILRAFIRIAETPEYVELVEKALKANPGYQDVLAKVLLHFEGLFGIKFGLNLDSLKKPANVALSEAPEGEEVKGDILSRAFEAFKKNAAGYSLKMALTVMAHMVAESLSIKEEEELIALIRSNQLHNALGTNEAVEDLAGRSTLEEFPEMMGIWLKDEHVQLMQSYYQAVLDSFPGQEKLIRKLFDSLADKFDYQPGFLGTTVTGDGATSKVDALNRKETDFVEGPPPAEPAGLAETDPIEDKDSLGKSIQDLKTAVKALELDEDLMQKYADALDEQEERRQKASAALEKAREEALKAGKSVEDEVNMFVILHNERALKRFGRAQQKFYEIYEEDFLSLSREEVFAARKKMKEDMKDVVKSKGYRTMFMERSLEDRFSVSALNLFNVKEDHDLESSAEFALEHAAQWFSTEELPWLRKRMEEELAQTRKSMKEQIEALDERWISYETSKEMLRPYVREADETEPSGNVFEQKVSSHLVLLQLATSGIMQMTMNLPDAMAWFWGVSIVDIWDQACKNPPYVAGDIDEELAGQSVESALAHAKALYKKKYASKTSTSANQFKENSCDSDTTMDTHGSKEGLIEPETEPGDKDNMAEVLNTLDALQKQADELNDQLDQRIDQLNREMKQEPQVLKMRGGMQDAEAEMRRRAQPTAKKGCYLATAVYGSYDAPEVKVLRRFRDQRLQRSRAGRLFIRVYYRLSPILASRMRRWPMVNAWVKRRLDRFVQHLRKP